MDSKQSQSVGYRIVSCQERSYEIKANSGGKITESDVSFKFGCNFNALPAGRLSISIISELMVAEQTVVKIESETIFEFAPFEAAFDVTSSGKIVDRIGIMPTLFSLAYGSTRGMIAIRTAGTSFAKFPLPIVDALDVTSKMQQPV